VHDTASYLTNFINLAMPVVHCMLSRVTRIPTLLESIVIPLTGFRNNLSSKIQTRNIVQFFVLLLPPERIPVMSRRLCAKALHLG
jgi:hypothetical protein